MIRIFQIVTETADDNRTWCKKSIAAASADEAIRKAKRNFSPRIKERLLSITLLASESED